MGTAATNLSYTVAGNKDFDPKHDLPFIGSFIGTKSNVDAREFSKVEDKIKAMDKRINALKDKPEALERYLDSNPDAYAAVEFYNEQVNGQLREVRAVANQVRANGELTPRERKLQLEEINGISSTIKRQRWQEEAIPHTHSSVGEDPCRFIERSVIRRRLLAHLGISD